MTRRAVLTYVFCAIIWVETRTLSSIQKTCKQTPNEKPTSMCCASLFSGRLSEAIFLLGWVKQVVGRWGRDSQNKRKVLQLLVFEEAFNAFVSFHLAKASRATYCRCAKAASKSFVDIHDIAFAFSSHTCNAKIYRIIFAFDET